MKYIVYSLILILLLTILLTTPVIAENQFLAGMEDITQSLIEGLDEELKNGEVHNIAVADFITKDDETTELSKFIAENIIISLTDQANKNIKVLERQRLNSVLEEHDLLTSGILKMDTAEKIGELLGANSIIVGKYYNLDTSIHVIAKIVSVKTGYIYAATQITLEKNETIYSILEEKYQSNLIQIDGGKFPVFDEDNNDKKKIGLKSMIFI
ncbi:MAG: FlgO family outer membrane protein [Halanaerobiaceae bacterium]